MPVVTLETDRNVRRIRGLAGSVDPGTSPNLLQYCSKSSARASKPVLVKCLVANNRTQNENNAEFCTRTAIWTHLSTRTQNI